MNHFPELPLRITILKLVYTPLALRDWSRAAPRHPLTPSATGYHPMPSEYDEQRDSTDTQLPGEYDLFDLMAKVTEDNLHAPVDSGPLVGREAL